VIDRSGNRSGDESGDESRDESCDWVTDFGDKPVKKTGILCFSERKGPEVAAGYPGLDLIQIPVVVFPVDCV